MIEGFIWIPIFIISYLLIYFSADFFIDNLKELGLKFNFSPFILGLLILGVDPEESIASIIAAINGLPYIAIGNVIGNSIISLTLCFALPAFFYKLDFKIVSNLYFIILFLGLLSIFLGIILNFLLVIFGFLSIFLYLIHLRISIIDLSKNEIKEMIKNRDVTEKTEKPKSTSLLILYVIFSLIFIFTGGEFLIISAESLMLLSGISESFFGFIIISFVTNVEELTLVFRAIKKKSMEIGLGGMIGKIIWNLCLTFGISAIIIMQYKPDLFLLYNWSLLMGLVLLYAVISRRGYINRTSASFLLVFFMCFILINLLNI